MLPATDRMHVTLTAHKIVTGINLCTSGEKFFSFFLIFFKFLLLFNYSCMPFLPIPPPHPKERNSKDTFRLKTNNQNFNPENKWEIYNNSSAGFSYYTELLSSSSV